MSNDNIKVCWITGGYNHGLEIINKIKESLKDAYVEYYGDESSAEYIEMQILGSGLFYNKRLIILRDLPKYSSSKSNDRWKKLFDQIPDDCTVIIDRVQPGSRRVIYKHIKSIGKVFDLPLYLKGSDAFSYIEDQFIKNGKSISNEASDLLIKKIGDKDNKGISVDELYMAIKQICSYIGKKKKNITIEDVFLSVPDNHAAIIWNFFEELDKKDYVNCQNIYYKLCRTTGVIEASTQISNMMLWRYRLMFLIKEQKSKNVNDKDIINKLLELKKFSKEGVAEKSIYSYSGNVYSESIINNAVKGFYSKKSPIEFYSRTELFKLMKKIYECILDMRDMEKEIEYKNTIDILIMFICGIIKENLLEKMRMNYDR